jgi:Icc-related predicted phosphoesterase
MRILAIADRPPKMPIVQTVTEQKIDLICTLGDLDILQLRELRNVTHIPKLGVYGNHCSGNYFDDLGITNMHLHVFEYQGLRFGGFEGCVRYKESSWAKMYSQDEATELLRSFPKVDIMLTHCPPFGINDDPNDDAHIGFTGLRDYLDQEQPKALLHGHTYPSKEALITQYKTTKIEYVYGDRIIEIS